jgi:MoaA/NifB/PqqE/SkfB family radical SAM enzyme
MENVYSQAKMFHYPKRLEALGRGEVLPPMHVRLKPINACNHNCFYCCYRNDNLYLGELLKEKDMIPEAKMAEIVRDMIDMEVQAVTFTGGGEPLIYPYLAKTARTLLEGGIKVAVLTNGGALLGEVAAVLAEGGSWVRVSADSVDGESIAKSRGIAPEAFGKIIRNIENFSRVKNSDCELGVNFIITQYNAHKVFDFIALMKNVGADHVKVSECVMDTTAAENNAYHAAHFEAVKAEIERAASTLSDDGFRVINKFHPMDDQYEKPYTTCPFVSGFLNVIAADQNVYTCQDKAYTRTGLLGSIRDCSLRTFWESAAYHRAVRMVNPSKVCDHHCVQHGKNLALIDYLGTDRRHLEFV